MLPQPPEKTVIELRKHYSGYFKGLPRGKRYRLQLMSARTPDELLRALDNIEKTYPRQLAPIEAPQLLGKRELSASSFSIVAQ
jgi:hypothetical protein